MEKPTRYEREVRWSGNRADVVSVRLIRKLAESIGGVSLMTARVGDVLELRRRDAELLLTAGWAVPERAEPPRAYAADRPATIVEKAKISVRIPADLSARWTQRCGTISPPEEPDGWEFVKGTSLNTLVIGPRSATRQLLNELRSYLFAPIVDVTPRDRLTLRSLPRGGTLMLHGIDRLPLSDQRRLCGWLNTVDRNTRVISTSPISLGQSLIAETFLSLLYYRLNVLCINLTATTRRGKYHTRLTNLRSVLGLKV